MRALLLSDVHADGPACPRQAALLAFLAREDADLLVLGGDIFQRWWHRDSAIFPAYAPVVEALRRFPRVLAVGGNHDFRFPAWLRDHGGGEGGPTCDFAWEGRRVRAAHGDVVDRSLGYRALTGVLRSRILERALDGVPMSGLWDRVGRLVHDPRGGGNDALLDAQRVWAQETLGGGDVDILVSGHAHLPALERVACGVWLNTGDFVSHFSYGEFVGGEARLWTVSPAGVPSLRARVELPPGP